MVRQPAGGSQLSKYMLSVHILVSLPFLPAATFAAKASGSPFSKSVLEYRSGDDGAQSSVVGGMARLGRHSLAALRGKEGML